MCFRNGNFKFFAAYCICVLPANCYLNFGLTLNIEYVLKTIYYENNCRATHCIIKKILYDKYDALQNGIHVEKKKIQMLLKKWLYLFLCSFNVHMNTYCKPLT